MNNLSFASIKKLEEIYQEAFYILDSDIFRTNYENLIKEFRRIYKKSNIAYSYKTNYIPKLCKIVDSLGGYAEVVSDMEYQIAKKIGVSDEKIYFNGPYKRYWAVEKLLIDGGIINIDSLHDFEQVKKVTNSYPNKKIKIGIRCNFDIYDDVVSRFGFDVNGDDFKKLLEELNKENNIVLTGLHVHFASRSLKYWPARVKGILNVYDRHFKNHKIDFISLGGGLYGIMPTELKRQFNDEIPSFKDYADVAATEFEKYFSGYQYEDKPELLIEPGSALAGNAMRFISKVSSIKNIRGKYIATLSGSIYNINPTLNKKNPPITVFLNEKNKVINADFDLAGFTCIESDYLYRDYQGRLSEGSYIVFGNVGSYSVVLKPPFILPNYPIIDLSEKNVEVIKDGESFEDLFKTYRF